jgi:hypothetical protein
MNGVTTMVAHRLVTARELVALPRNSPHRGLEAQLVVQHTIATRACEFDEDGTVFTVRGTDAVSKQPIRCYFYNEWATAASFVGVGDVMTLKGFTVIDVPNFRHEEVSPDDLPHADPDIPHPALPPQYFLTPCRGNVTTLAVAQPGEQGDTIEIIVAPPTFEPTARVIRRRTEGLSLASGKVLDDGISRAL